jgi:hypothetical protein
VTHEIPSHGKKVEGKKCAGGVSSNGSGTLCKLAPILASMLCSCIFQSSHAFAHPFLKLNPRSVMVLVLLDGKRDSLSCDISDISNIICFHSLSVIHRGIHRGKRSA